MMRRWDNNKKLYGGLYRRGYRFSKSLPLPILNLKIKEYEFNYEGENYSFIRLDKDNYELIQISSLHKWSPHNSYAINQILSLSYLPKTKSQLDLVMTYVR